VLTVALALVTSVTLVLLKKGVSLPPYIILELEQNILENLQVTPKANKEMAICGHKIAVVHIERTKATLQSVSSHCFALTKG